MKSANDVTDSDLHVPAAAPSTAAAGGVPPLLAAWRDLKQAEPHLRQRDAAARLGVSEAELVASRLGDDPNDGATLLDTRWMEILTALEACGQVTALSRNDSAVIEDKGAFMNISGAEHLAQVVGPRIDLRLFLSRWRYGFAFVEALDDGPRRSVQFYDDRGTAVHKVFLEKEASLSAWEALMAAHATDARSIAAPDPTPAGARPERPDSEVDVAGLHAGWAALQDTHEFFMLLHKFGVTRTQALRLSPNWATPVAPLSHRQVFEACRDQELPLMVFIGNRGIIQIHTGAPKKLVQMNSWFNVMDKDWNMHLQETGIAATWVVRKPTKDGVVTSLELFDQRGEIIALLFSKRHDGQHEVPAWTQLLTGLRSAA
jgi:putative hemin transport protein